ncbi:peroxiredoxin family protein [Neolewinella agarilytica]|uniref:peroxiredoxin family protein n=1 Tax=Neolewinella agarilytica TaxID=478744 RepID=UPI002356BFAE|nr:redoxin domain-containing protein [Neolewinella agarilytica]
MLLSTLVFTCFRCSKNANVDKPTLRHEKNHAHDISFFPEDTLSPLLLTFISPACEHCQYQTQALLSDHEQKPNDLRLAFLSDVHPDSLKSYASQFEYDTATTVFLWDEGGKIAQQMEVSSYPTMFLYDTAGVHLQTIVGEAKPGYVYKHFHDTH